MRDIPTKRRIVLPEDIDPYNGKSTLLKAWRRKAKRANMCCPVCTHRKPMTVDHIVPLMILKSFAVSDIDMYFLKYEFELNFQMLCFECNLSKGERLDFSNPKTIKILDSLIAFYRYNPRLGRPMNFMEAQQLVDYTYKNLIS